MRIFLAALLLLHLTATSQQTLNGIVQDKEKKLPIPYASIYLNNTSIGTRSDEKGHFALVIPAGRHELVASSVGYETVMMKIDAATIGSEIVFNLQLKAAEMETVVIEPYEKDGWKQWGKLFQEFFLGVSNNANDCKIKNEKVIRFRYSKSKKTLDAFASEPLIIENKALGYTLHYDMQNFHYDFNSHFLFYSGYPFFQPMKGNERQEKRWEKKREEAYEGSMMQFMRSVYRNRLDADGFDVWRLKKDENLEKSRVKSVYRNNLRINRENGTITTSVINKDSDVYYNKILQQPDFIRTISKHKLSGDSIAYAIEATVAGLDFLDYLLVNYRKKAAPDDYMRATQSKTSAMLSELYLTNQRPISIEANGLFYMPEDLLSNGYWGWSEKIARMLPFNYKPN